MSNKNLLIIMGYVTLIVFPLIGILLLYWIHGEWIFIFKNGLPLYWQIPIGCVLGLLLAIGLRFVLQRSFIHDTSTRYIKLINEFGLTREETIFLSVCAGIGEEVLFRGAIQTFVGIPLTAIAFVALHGYLNPKDWRISIYGIILCLIFIGIGYIMQFWGIYVCIAIHIIIDVVLFEYMRSTAFDEN